jgi:formate/nitrite transporter FocA (FNT family)
MKGVIAGLLIALAIAFGITLYAESGKMQDVAAVLEWTISLGYT